MRISLKIYVGLVFCTITAIFAPSCVVTDVREADNDPVKVTYGYLVFSGNPGEGLNLNKAEDWEVYESRVREIEYIREAVFAKNLASTELMAISGASRRYNLYIHCEELAGWLEFKKSLNKSNDIDYYKPEKVDTHGYLEVVEIVSQARVVRPAQDSELDLSGFEEFGAAVEEPCSCQVIQNSEEERQLFRKMEKTLAGLNRRESEGQP
jgi:hypothetical protein